MNYFSKKTMMIINIITLFTVVIGTSLILSSSFLVSLIQNFLQENVFHREFSIEKWQPTILSLISFPIYLSLIFNACFFVKYDEFNKKFVLFIYFVSISILAIFALATKDFAFMDSDMASEILLAKECYLAKSFWPISWNYSTEIRLLNVQLISGPLFFITSNWKVVKVLTSILICVVLFFSQNYLLKSLGIQKKWLKLLVNIVAICPFSYSIWKYNTIGNYYIPHIVLSFLYLGLFFNLSLGEKANWSNKKLKIFNILFFALAFLNGLATIRYLIIFMFPLALVICYTEISIIVNVNEKFNLKETFLENKKIFYSLGGFLLGGVGYCCNVTILSSIYSFSDWNTTTLREIGTIALEKVYSDIFGLFGYLGDVSAMTPSGLSNLCLYVFLIFLCFGFVIFYKNKKENDSKQNIYIIFTIASFLFAGFLYVKCDYNPRYFIMELAFIPTCVAVFLENQKISNMSKYMLGVSFAVLFLGNTFITCQSVLNSYENDEKKSVIKFLNESDYDFGYATFWNANVFTYMTNGKVEIANLKRNQKDGKTELLSNYKCDYWLTPNRYYSDKNDNKKCFLLVTTDEYENSISKNNIFTNGKEVYSDEFYKIFEYKSIKNFKESF